MKTNETTLHERHNAHDSRRKIGFSSREGDSVTRILAILACLSLTGCYTTFYGEDGKTPIMRVPWPMRGSRTTNGTCYAAEAAPGTVDAATTCTLHAIDHSEPIAKYAIDKLGERIGTDPK